MSAITINVQTFTNEKWGEWEDDKGQHSACLDLFHDQLNIVSHEYIPKAEMIETINKFVQEKKPFLVKSLPFMESYYLEDRTVNWEGSDVPTRQAIVEKYVLAKLRTFGQKEQPPLTPINVDGLAQLIDYDDEVNDTQAFVHEKPALPGTSHFIGVLLKREETKDVGFFSCSARGACVWEFLTDLFYAVVAPFMVVYMAFTEDNWRHWGWTVLDTAIIVPLAPLVFTANAIQNLLGAIIHPSIALAEKNY